MPLSEDHKPDRPDETERVRQAGGDVVNVMGTWRVSTAEGAAAAAGQAAQEGDLQCMDGHDYLGVARKPKAGSILDCCCAHACCRTWMLRPRPLIAMHLCDRHGCPGVARAFGDQSLKFPKPLVISTPEIQVVDVQEDDCFVVLACDGVWDVLSNQEVVDIGIVRARRLASPYTYTDICTYAHTHTHTHTHTHMRACIRTYR